MGSPAGPDVTNINPSPAMPKGRSPAEVHAQMLDDIFGGKAVLKVNEHRLTVFDSASSLCYILIIAFPPPTLSQKQDLTLTLNDIMYIQRTVINYLHQNEVFKYIRPLHRLQRKSVLGISPSKSETEVCDT